MFVIQSPGEPQIFGLPNSGNGLMNVCYLNSSLQCLVHTLYPFLSSEIMKTHLANCRKSENKKCFTCLLSELSQFDNETDKKKSNLIKKIQNLSNYFAELRCENFLSTTLILKTSDVSKIFM